MSLIDEIFLMADEAQDSPRRLNYGGFASEGILVGRCVPERTGEQRGTREDRLKGSSH